MGDDGQMGPEIRIRRRTRLSAQERRNQIIDAATAIIAARGYWGLSIQDVADSCGITVNGVLHHVGTKDGLLVAVLEHRDQADAFALADRLGVDHSSPSWETNELTDTAVQRGTSLLEMCDAVVARNATQPEVVRLYCVLAAESLAPDHPAHDYFRTRQQITLDGFSKLTTGAPDPRQLATHLLALMDGLQLQWLRDPGIDLNSAWHSSTAGLPR